MFEALIKGPDFNKKQQERLESTVITSHAFKLGLSDKKYIYKNPKHMAQVRFGRVQIHLPGLTVDSDNTGCILYLIF